ncbi:MAG: hypothetical protein ACI9UU_003890 [Candidatus Azotimanducaceae bacterium]|jgi:hypothetical protein
MEAMAFFEWLDGSFLASISKAYGGLFAVVQMFHLLGLALLGGMVLVGDLRLLNVVLRDVPSEEVAVNTDKFFDIAVWVLLASGIFMSSAVALKLYYNEMFWAKMSALAVGLLFVYLIRRPLLRHDHASINTWTLRSIAVSSILVWFTVAACGRWIGFS